MIVGGVWARPVGTMAARYEITPGTATAAMYGSLWGLWVGFASAWLAGWNPDEEPDSDPLLATMMVAGNAGLAAGAFLGSRVPLSRKRARLISLAGVVGGFAGMGINMIAETDEARTVISTTFAASLTGLVVGTHLTGGTRGGDGASDAAEAAASLPAPGALLNWSGGDWALSTPLPSPVWQPSGRAGAGKDWPGRSRCSA